MKLLIDNKIPFLTALPAIFEDIRYFDGPLTRCELGDTDVLLVRTRTRCNAGLLEGSAVKFIGTATIGTDHIDMDYCRSKGITVVNAAGCNAPAVMQYVVRGLALIITDGGGNVIRRVDGIPFGEYLKKFNIDASALEDFPISLRARNPNAVDDDDHMAIINLVKLQDDQSGVFGSNVTVGDSITLCYLARENIENSTKHCLKQLRERMAEKEREGYRFDMILAVSCVARYYVIIRPPGNFEAEALKAGIPEGVDAFGIFAFAEYGPVPDPDGGLKNAKHSQTLVMCAF